MNVTDFQEIWQVDVGDQVYEASFEVLTQWIGEGSLLPQDKVRRGNLRWIEARRVPTLIPFFNAMESGAAQAVVTTTAAPPDPATPQSPSAAPGFSSPSPHSPANPYQTTVTEPVAFGNQPALPPAVHDPAPVFTQPTAVPVTFEPAPAFGAQASLAASDDAAVGATCAMHPESPAFFVCDTCVNAFCKVCPTSYGGTVRICPFCGAMCQRIDQKVSTLEKEASYRAAITEGFGFADFGRALSYPFRFKTSLFFGAILFSIFTLGQGASSFGGMFMVAASMMCYMLGNMLYFGILTNVLENFSQGFTDRNFMPSFDDFSLWDDVVHPFFLSIAVYLVSFGLFIAIFVGSIFWVVGSAAKTNEEIPFPGANDPNIERFNEAYNNGEMPTDEEMNRSFQNQPRNEEEEFRKMDEFIRESRKKQLESGIGKSPETLEKERSEMITGLMKMAVPLLLLAVAAFLWGIFYLPAACLVAGYTRSFVATLNPKIGLETIRILGGDYFKILGMGLIIGIISMICGGILAVIFAAFNLPAVGNLPATAIGALFSFYLSVVFSIVLGFALYKNAEKLHLFRG